MDARRRSRAGWAVIGATSAVLVAYNLSHVLHGHAAHETAIDDIVGWVPTVALVVALAVVWHWVQRRDDDPPCGWLFCKWFLAGGVLLGGAGAATFLIEIARGAHVVEPVFTSVMWVVGGNIVGLYVAYAETRRLDARHREEAASEDARRLAQRLSVINRVLRHDVRTDLNVILGYADVIGDHFESEPDELEGLRERANRLVGVTSQARLVAELLENDATGPINVGEHLADRIDDVRSEHPDIDLHADVNTDAVADAHRLVDVALDIVIDNALAGAPPDMTFDVTCRVVDDEVEVVLVDDGPEMPGTQRVVLQETEETALEHADGIGLWTVKWAVEESNGKFWFERTADETNRLVLRLPARKE
ncbi:sensor histidine kinase [Halarchaeum sp. P4]|uniref:sensor histidine kinase n=1 Tax=Halarchaeum sp. P4 TaxID=3421639 RepID=UPI003EBCAEB2